MYLNVQIHVTMYVTKIECSARMNFRAARNGKKLSFWLFRPNLQELVLFHPYFVRKCRFREISMIKIVILDKSKPISLFMVLSLDRMCQRGLHAVLWSHIGTLMHRLAAEPCSAAGHLFPFRCPSGTILLTPFSMVCDWRVSRAGPMLLYWPKLLYPYYSLLLSFPFSSCCL